MWYDLVMRTTLEIEDDVLTTAKNMAEQRGTTTGRMVSLLLRKAFEARPAAEVRNGVPLFRPVADAPKPSLDLINRLRDEI